MGKLRDRRRCPPPVNLTSDDIPEKQELLTYSSAYFPCCVCVHLCSLPKDV